MVIDFCTSSHLHLCYQYVCTKFNFNPFCTFQDIAQTGIHYKTKWLSGDYSVNIHCRIMGFVHSTSSNVNLVNALLNLETPGPNFTFQDISLVLILIIADQLLDDSLCCFNKCIQCLFGFIGQLYILLFIFLINFLKSL